MVDFQHCVEYFQDRAMMNDAIDKENASFLLSVIGIANTVGRIVLGWISDKPWLNRLYTYNFSLAICGISKSKLKTISFRRERIHFLMGNFVYNSFRWKSCENRMGKWPLLLELIIHFTEEIGNVGKVVRVGCVSNLSSRLRVVKKRIVCSSQF